MNINLLKYSKTQVNKAGNILAYVTSESEIKDFEWAFEVLSNWRACHTYPINTFQSTLRKKIKDIDSEAIVATRLKRTPSIIAKLIKNRGMQLSRMQDIGGLRAIVNNIEQLNQLYDAYKKTRFDHVFVEPVDNYVENPKDSGYRSIHLIYKYKKRHQSPHDGFLVELQFRTKLQHAWATAVETAGTFLKYSLKSSEGPEEWLNFFALAGSAFAHLEGTPLVPGYTEFNKIDTYKKAIDEAQRLGIKDKLAAFNSALQEIQVRKVNAGFYLIELKISDQEKVVNITPYTYSQYEEANDAYAKTEDANKSYENNQVVLVRGGSVSALRRAYPNYFLDTQEFLNYLDRIKIVVDRAR